MDILKMREVKIFLFFKPARGDKKFGFYAYGSKEFVGQSTFLIKIHIIASQPKILLKSDITGMIHNALVYNYFHLHLNGDYTPLI